MCSITLFHYAQYTLVSNTTAGSFCLSTILPILPKSGKVVHHHKKYPKPNKIKKENLFDKPSWKNMGQQHGWVTSVVTLWLVCVMGCPHYAQHLMVCRISLMAQMPLRIFLLRVLEQCVVFEDVTTFLSRVPARRGGTALPVSHLGHKALWVASVTFRSCCGVVMWIVGTDWPCWDVTILGKSGFVCCSHMRAG